jgi:hypothetical protein
MGRKSRAKRTRRVDGQGSPTFADRAPLPFAELPPPAALHRTVGVGVNDYLRTYRLGECSVIVTKEFGRWHMSVAHPDRYPHWDEVAEARYRTTPGDVWMALALPPLADYINVNPNCFQLIQIEAPDPMTP